MLLIEQVFPPMTYSFVSSILHFVIVPNYKEDESTLKACIESLRAQSISSMRIILVLAMEFAEKDSLEKAHRLREEYRHSFFDIIISVHRLGFIPGEQAGKSANESYSFLTLLAMAQSERKQDDSKLELTPAESERRQHWIRKFFDNGIITVADADSILYPHHLLDVTRQYVEKGAVDRHETIWQAPIASYANLYELPAATRIFQITIAVHELAALSCQWEECIPFSTYSISTQLAQKVGGWACDVMAEDWHNYLRCYFATGGKATVSRVYMPVINYAVESPSGKWLESVIERYHQAVRHMWAIIEVPFAITYLSRLPIEKRPNMFRFVRIVWKMIAVHFQAVMNFVIIYATIMIPFFLAPSGDSTDLHYLFFSVFQITTSIFPFTVFSTMFVHCKYERLMVDIWRHASDVKKIEKKTILGRSDGNWSDAGSPNEQPSSPGSIRLTDGSSVEFPSNEETKSLLANKLSAIPDTTNYITILKRVTWKRELTTLLEFFVVPPFVALFYGFLPLIVSFTRMIFSPYFAYKVAAKPIIKQ